MITTPQMELALAKYFNSRANLIVPNVHWGMNMHECDLLIVSQAGYVTEVEIKISMSDLIADAKKKHGHRDRNIKYLYFALPHKMMDTPEKFKRIEMVVPERAGIIGVWPPTDDRWPNWRCGRIRDAITMKGAGKMTDAYRYKVARLGALRIWNLKQKLEDLK